MPKIFDSDIIIASGISFGSKYIYPHADFCGGELVKALAILIDIIAFDRVTSVFNHRMLNIF